MGFLGFARPVDHTTDDRDIQRHQQIFEAPLQLVHGFDHIEVLPRAARAGDEVDTTGTQVQGFENVVADFHFLDRVSRQRDANSIANPFGEQHTEAHGGFHRARAQTAGFGDTQVQRLDNFLGQQAIGGDGHEHVGSLHADLEVLEIQAFQVLDMTQGRLDQRGRGRLAVFLLQVFFQGTGVHADADRDPAVTSGINHRTHAIFTTDVARVDAQAVNAQFGYAQSDLVVEVDVGNQRHLDQLLDLAECLGSVHVRHRNAHDIDASGFQAIDLGHGGGHVIGVAVGHALHSDRRIAANRHVTDPNLAGFATFDWRFAVHDLLTQLQASSLATGERSDINHLTVVADLRATGEAQTYGKGWLAADRNVFAFALETAQQHFAAAVSHLRPAISGEQQLNLTLAGHWSHRGACGSRGGCSNNRSSHGRRRSNRCWSYWSRNDRRSIVNRCRRRYSRGCECWSRRGRLCFGRCFSRGLGLRQGKRGRAFSLTLRDSLVFWLVQRMDLSGTVGAFDFNVFRSQAGQVLGAQRGLIVPPDKTTANHRDQQQQADNSQNGVGNPNRLFDTTQAMDVAALGVGAGGLVELLDQYGLVHAEQFGVSANIAASKGMPWQLVESAGFQITQGINGEVELEGHFGQRPAIAFAGLAQSLTGVNAIRCYNFGMRRFHHCSDWYC